MHALKTPNFLRPSSRPSSPLPTPPPLRTDADGAVPERATRPLTKLSLANFRKASPAPTAAPSATLVQDGSYLEALSLKLSEATTKALAQPTTTVAAVDVLNGKRPIPAGRGQALGELIAAELHASQGNVHLQRAILRLLHRPLSVLLSTLSAQLLPILSSSAFLIPTAPSMQNPSANATQLHALAIVDFANELLDCLDGLDAEVCHDPRGDGLNNFREGLVSLISRVVNPLIGGVKADLLPLIQGLENVNPALTTSIVVKSAGGAKAVAHQHPSISSLQALMPLYAKALARYTAPKCCQSTLATLLISIIWRSIVALSHRPTSSRSRSDSVSAASATSSAAVFKKRLGSSTTPPSTPPPSRFTMKLPGSRPPSPAAASFPTAAADARVLYDLLSLLPKPAPSNDANRVAREAVDEAFEALGALTALLGAVDAGSEVREDLDLELLTDGLPVLIALPVLLRWSGHGEPQVISAMLGVSDVEYREGCLSGFGRADECMAAVVPRILDVLQLVPVDDPKTTIVIKFLEGSIAH